jgi:hypothetical protein
MSKFCTACKYFGEPFKDELGQTLCLHEQAIRTMSEFFVAGDPRFKTRYTCAAMRAGFCGDDGKLFEPAPPAVSG